MSARAPRLFASLAVILVAACGTTPAASPSQTPSSPPASTGPTEAPSPSPVAQAQLILRITSEGGFIGPAANLATVPEVSVYADGRIMTPGAVDAVYPGPLLPTVDVRDVGTVGAQAIVAAIRAAGLDVGRSGTDGGVQADTGTTVFTVTLDGSPAINRLILGGGPPGVGGLGGSQDPLVAGALDLLSRLNDPTETWGAVSAPTSQLTPVAYHVYVALGAPPADPSLLEPTLGWPLPTPLAQFGVAAVPDRGIKGLRQGAVLGADAATLGPVLAKANVLTTFSSGGMLYTLYVRPLLPDEVPV
jgi:hypothetical protein